MAEIMTCPGCQTTLRIRDDMAGKKVKCPRCAHLVSIPARDDGPTEVAPAGADITADAPAHKKDVATRPCPSCGEPIPLTARKCRHCKAPVEEEADEAPELRTRYKPCPRCGEYGAKRVTWTPWGSFYGPALFTHVRCPGCGYQYNGRTGRSNIIPAIIFVTIPALLITAMLGFIGWIILAKGYFAQD